MTVLAELTQRFADAFRSLDLDPAFGEVVESNRPDLGQFQCNGALPAARQAGNNPRDIAQSIIDQVDREGIADLSIAGPGFVNITLTDEALCQHVSQAAASDLGIESASDPKTVVVDYGGPNVAKAMHVGHLRATLIGDAIARIGRLIGHHIITDAHFGDWGTQMGMVICGLADRYPDLPYFDPDFTGPYPDDAPVTLEDLQEIYPKISAAAKTDPEVAEAARRATLELQEGRPGYRALWQHLVAVSMGSQRQDFHDLGVDFDLWYAESTVHDRVYPLVASLREQGVAVESEGALVVPVAEPNDTKDIPPLIMLKSDGAYLYTTTDVATVDLRVSDLHADVVLYVVDARQGLHFEQVFRAVRKAGIAPGTVSLEHIKFGTMNGPDGKPFRTRAGGVVSLRDLIAMVTDAAAERLEQADIAQGYPDDEKAEIARRVGLAALKFGELQNHRASDYVFDLDRFLSFDGKTGPYLQYGAVRIASIEREASEQGLATGDLQPATVDAERGLYLQILRFPSVVDRAWEFRAPNHIAEYAFELTQQFNRFYEACHILREGDPARQASWLRLVAVTREVLVTALNLLGIEVPDRM